MAYEFVRIVHGEQEARQAKEQAKAAFGGDVENMPSAEIKLNGNETVVDILCLVDICKTKSEARRLIEAGAVKIYDRTILSVDEGLTPDEFKSRAVILHKGKKTHLKVMF